MATETILIVGLITSAVSAGVGYTQQRKAAKAQEAASEYNAKLARNQAAQTQEAAALNAQRMQQQKRRRLASARAKAAGSGVSFTGSVLDTYLDESDFLERDIQTQLYNSESQARAQRNQASMISYEGGLKADATRSNANAQLISSAGDIAADAYSGSQTSQGLW